MKKRFLCLLLSAITILLCFAGCSKEVNREEIMAEIGKEASDGATTISMYLVSEQPVSKKQEQLMEEKVNEITTEKFNIKMDLRYYTEDEYYQKLEANMKTSYDVYENKKTDGLNIKADNPVYVGENGLPAVYYPVIQDFDVDIFYMSGYDKYKQYLDAGYLSDLGEELKGSSKVLNSVINSTLLQSFISVTNNGSGSHVYAIPTNRTIGEYTYILLNKDALDMTAYSKEDIKYLTDDNCKDLLGLINANYRDEFVPLYSNIDGYYIPDAYYYSANELNAFESDFSLIAGFYDNNMGTDADKPNPNIELLPTTIREKIRILKEYEFNNYYAQEGEQADKQFAVGYLKGTPVDIEEYLDDYEVIVVENPKLQTTDLYESMFAVGKYTDSVSASMQILTYLNTDVEFRNLLLYGVEGENYIWRDSDILDDDGNPYRVVSRQVEDPDKLYIMSAVKTGNVALAYDAEGENPKYNQNILSHNADLEATQLTGLSFYDGIQAGKNPTAAAEAGIAYITAESWDNLKKLSEASKGYYDAIKAAKNKDELEAVFEKINGESVADLGSVNDRNENKVFGYLGQWMVTHKKWTPPLGS